MHNRATPKDGTHSVDADGIGYRPTHGVGTPAGETWMDRDAHEAAWVAAFDRARAASPRRIANVRAASSVARWVALVLLTALALVAVIGIAYLWGD